MQLTILGSGGPLTTPRPACDCRVCASARQNGGRGRRGGPSVFVHEANILIDATEDVVPLLNREGIDRVDNLFLTHWHPDHTAGFRFVEQVNYMLHWQRTDQRGRGSTQVWMNAETASRHAANWRFFESQGYCQLHEVQPGSRLDLGEITATWFSYAPDGFLSGFVLDDGHARILLTLDETKGLAAQVAGDPSLQGCDLHVSECGWFERDPEGRVLVPERGPLREQEAGFVRDTLPLIEAAGAHRTILTHLMDLHGRTPEEFDALAATLAPHDVQFAFDGLGLEV